MSCKQWCNLKTQHADPTLPGITRLMVEVICIPRTKSYYM